MPSAPSLWVTVVFVALVAVISLSFVVSTFRSARRAGRAENHPRFAALSAALAVSAVLVASYVLASRGVLRDFASFPPPMLRLLFAVTALTLVLAFSRFGTRFAQGLPLAWLVGFQVFRVMVELVLFELHRENAIPIQMTFEGRNFDVLTGLTAPVVAWLFVKNRISRRWVLAWNVAGLALLLDIIAIALLSMPTSFRAFEGMPNTLVTGAPFVWLPTVLVQAALFGHIVVFRRLAMDARPGEPPR